MNNKQQMPFEASRRSPMNTKTKPTAQALHTTALIGLFFAVVSAPVVATAFSGNLKEVTITDAQATNKPPVAAFSYTVNGNAITFDASGSSDSDGSISSYKWDFGDGTTGEGASVTHQYQTTTPYPATLTVMDNANAATITQVRVSTAPAQWLQDNFSETSTVALTAHNPDIGGAWTMANINGQIFSINGGKGSVINSNTDGDIAINSATPQDTDYSISVTGVLNNTLFDRLFGVCGRFDAAKKIGYCAYLKADGKFVLAKYTGSSTIYGTALSTKTLNVAQAEMYTIKLTFSGTSIQAEITGIDSISADDSTYSSGKAGIILRRNNSFIKKIESN